MFCNPQRKKSAVARCYWDSLFFLFFFFPRTLHLVNVYCQGDYLGLDLHNEEQSLCSCCTIFILMQFCFSFDWVSSLFGCYAVDICDTIHASHTDYLLIHSTFIPTSLIWVDFKAVKAEKSV